MKKFLKTLILGPEDPARKRRLQGYTRTNQLLKEVWKEPTFGLLRLVRLFLMVVSYFSPILIIDQIIGSDDQAVVTVWRELYYLARATFLIIVLFYCDTHEHPYLIPVVLYLIFDILSHLAGQIFAWGKHSVDPRRSLLLSLMNYFEVILAFAIFYLHWDVLPWRGKATALQAFYFSLVTGTTVGYGDYAPKNEPGEKIVIAQLAIFLLFAVLFISTFISRIPPETTDKSGTVAK